MVHRTERLFRLMLTHTHADTYSQLRKFNSIWRLPLAFPQTFRRLYDVLVQRINTRCAVSTFGSLCSTTCTRVVFPSPITDWTNLHHVIFSKRERVHGGAHFFLGHAHLHPPPTAMKEIILLKKEVCITMEENGVVEAEPL